MTNPTEFNLSEKRKELSNYGLKDRAKLDLTERIILISIINDRIKEKNVN